MMFNDEKRTIILMLLVALLVLASPIIIKWALNQNTYLSEETYYNVRMVEQMKDEGILHQDLLQEREYDFNLFHYLVAKSGIGLDFAAKYLPIIMGVISLLLVYILLKSINLGQNDVFFAIIILATTPVFLFKFTTFSPDILGFPLLLLGLVLFFRGYYASIFFLGATAFINVMYPFMALVMITGDYFTRRKKLWISAANIAVIILALVAGIFLLNINYLAAFIPVKLGLNGFLIEFGAIKGFALAMIGLAIIGLFSWWNREVAKTPVLITMILLLVVSFFFESSRLQIALMLALFAGLSISYLANREWEIVQLKSVTLLLILCILVFSAVLMMNYQVKNIDEQKMTAISYISSSEKANEEAAGSQSQETAADKDTVLSVERNGFLIEYAAKKKAYLDDNSYMFTDYTSKKQTADKIYYTRNLPELESLLKKEGITYIFVDSEMRSGEVWNGRYEGLLFFLENSDKFTKVFYDDNIQIYRYLP
jgi:hypothetical protein